MGRPVLRRRDQLPRHLGHHPATHSAKSCRVLVPGGRVGLTVWGHLKPAPGSWALAPFRLAAAGPGRPPGGNGVARTTRESARPCSDELGFVDVERIDVPFVWEFADPAAYARALMSMGPAHEAISNVGEERFLEAAIEVAEDRVREGLPMRAEIPVVGYVARGPSPTRAGPPTGHLPVEVDPGPAANACSTAMRTQMSAS